VADIGAYCREVEAHLTKVNGGHLVRIVGPGFSLVRGWAEAGVPLSVVFRGIEQKAERHRAGTSRRPLRIEFCEDDVQEVFETWRRAVGVAASAEALSADGTMDGGAGPVDRGSGIARKSVSRDLDRAAERLVRLAGRLDLPDTLRDAVSVALTAVAETREAIRTLRGPQRQERLAGLADVDQQLVDAALAALPEGDAAIMRAEAEASLDSYRSRLSTDAWTRAVRVNLTRLVRDHYQLPTLVDGEIGNRK
jgi:hypothetical protein